MANYLHKLRFLLPVCVSAVVLPSARASISIKISASPSTTVSVGSPVSLNATASDSASSSATFTYQYEVQSPGTSNFALLKDFYYTNTFKWAPTQHEGVYVIQVNVKSSTGATGSAQLPIVVNSLVTSGTPVVTATQNPMVALYSAPSCPAGSGQVTVQFKSASATAWQSTPFQSCNGYSLNFFIAGMTATTKYTLQQEYYQGSSETSGPLLTFTTGIPPVSFPARTTLTGPVAPTAAEYPFILQTPSFYPFATDLYGNIVWYLAAYSSSVNPHEQGSLLRNTNSGTMLGVQDDPNDHCINSSSTYCGDHQFIREFDLAGNIVRETNWTILNQEVNAIRAAEGKSAVNLNFPSHDATRLPNGDTAIIITDQRVANQGAGPVLVDADAVLVLDQNFRPAWFWDAFDMASAPSAGCPNCSITRIGGQLQTCSIGQNGCDNPRVFQSNGQPYTIANDWTHCNSLTLDPLDGNLILSSRHQSWVWKLAYVNGAGDGHIIWTLGDGGTFTLANNLPSSTWFNYQHAVQFQSNLALTLFDNNNLQHAENGANSRGQGWSLDETHLIATPLINVDLGAFSLAVGYANVIGNQNYDFGAGFLKSGTETETYEYTPSGSLVYAQTFQSFSYRPIRLISLYTNR